MRRARREAAVAGTWTRRDQVGRHLAAALPVAPLLAIFVAWGAADGGYDPVLWLPGALFALGAAVIVLLWRADRLAVGRATAAALLLLLAFTAWCFASVGWAAERGDAWDGANRTLLYCCVFAVFAWQRVRPRLALGLIGGYSVAIALVGVIDVARAVHGAPSQFFIAGRLAAPIAYPNANAALFLAAFAVAVTVAAQRALPVLLRAACLAAGGLLLELALLCQSRASLVAFPLAIGVLVALSSQRLSLLLMLGLVAVPVGLGAARLLAVYGAVVSGHDAPGRVAEARTVLIWSAVGLLFAGLVVGLLARRVRLPARWARGLGIALAVAGGAAAAGGIALLLVRFGNPVSLATRGWNDFKQKQTPTAASASSHLLSGLSSSRYDIWRVALHEFAAHPFRGVGVDNYALDYLRLRRTRLEPMYPHSLELRLVAQTGIVGAILFAGFLVSACAAAAPAFRRRAGPSRRALGAACLAAFAYWVFHASVDWLWAFPGLTAFAFACLGLASQASGRRPRTAREPRSPEGGRRPMLVGLRYALVIPSCAAAASLASPWAAARENQAALGVWRTEPELAFRRLDLARRLNPLSDQSDLTAGLIATRLGDRRRAEARFAAAVERNPAGWFARLELAALASERNDRVEALRQLRRARSLNPGEPLISAALDTVRSGRSVSTAAISGTVRERLELLTGRIQR